MMPKAARVRSVSFRPRATHSLRIREYPRPKASLTERDSYCIVAEIGTCVNGKETRFPGGDYPGLDYFWSRICGPTFWQAVAVYATVSVSVFLYAIWWFGGLKTDEILATRLSSIIIARAKNLAEAIARYVFIANTDQKPDSILSRSKELFEVLPLPLAFVSNNLSVHGESEGAFEALRSRGRRKRFA